jgi:hypothetical protein
MSKVGTLILGLVLGLIVGGGGILYYLSPRASVALSGVPIQPPDPNASSAGTAVIELKQDFFAPVIKAIVNNNNTPSFPLNLSGQTDQPVSEIACGKISLKPEGSGTTTALKLENGQILIPLAFTGNFNVPVVGCTEFNGWAQASLDLRYKADEKMVEGYINVQTVNLDNISPVAGGLITPIVQSTLNNRVNPVPVLRGDQIALKVPIKSSGTTLKGQVRDIRAEVKNNSLFLYISYDFSGERDNSPVQ